MRQPSPGTLIAVSNVSSNRICTRVKRSFANLATHRSVTNTTQRSERAAFASIWGSLPIYARTREGFTPQSTRAEVTALPSNRPGWCCQYCARPKLSRKVLHLSQRPIRKYSNWCCRGLFNFSVAWARVSSRMCGMQLDITQTKSSLGSVSLREAAGVGSFEFLAL